MVTSSPGWGTPVLTLLHFQNKASWIKWSSPHISTFQVRHSHTEFTQISTTPLLWEFSVVCPQSRKDFKVSLHLKKNTEMKTDFKGVWRGTSPSSAPTAGWSHWDLWCSWDFTQRVRGVGRFAFPYNMLSSSAGRAWATKIPYCPTLQCFPNSLKQTKMEEKCLRWWSLSYIGC